MKKKQVSESYWDSNVSQEPEQAREITPVPALAQAIEERLCQRVKRIVELGAFLPGKMRTTSADFLLVRSDDGKVHLLFNVLNFDFNGNERVLLNVPLVMDLVRRQDDVYKVMDIRIDPEWRKVFMISSPGRQKGLLPGKRAEGGLEMKMLSQESLRAIVDHVADAICGKVEYVPKEDDVLTEGEMIYLVKQVINQLRNL